MLEGGYEQSRAAAGDGASCDARAWRSLAGVSAGDHVCCAFCDEDDQRGLVKRFAVDALAHGMRLLYVTYGSSEARVTAALAEAGIDVGGLRDAGQIELRRAADLYLADGGFDPDRQIGRLAREVEGAHADGFPALAVTAEMCWAIDSRTDPERLVAYERAVGRLFDRGEVAALCQYDALALSDELRSQLDGAHPLSIATGPAGTVATCGPASFAELAGVDGLRLAGEIDALSAPYMRARIREHLDAGGDLLLDLAELTFLDVAAARTLAELADALAPDARLVLEGPPRALQRVLRLCGWDERPSLVLRESAFAFDAEFGSEASA